MQSRESLQNISEKDQNIEIQYQDGDVIIGNVMTHNLKATEPENEMAKILVVQEGQVQFFLNGKMYRLDEDDLIYVGPRSHIQDLLATPGAKVQFLCIRAAIFSTFFQSPTFMDLAFAIYQHPVLHFTEEDKLQMQELVGILQNFIHKGNPFERQIVTKILEAFIYILLGYYQQKLADSLPQQDAEPKISSMDTIFRKFMNILAELEVKPRFVKYYSDRLNISAKYLSSCCQKASGMSCFAHINRAVLNDVEKYLRQPDITYKEIAYKLGFPNHSFFSKYVREHLGYTPTQYRNKYLKQLAQQVEPRQ